MDEAQTQIERQHMDVDIVCVGFGPAFGLRSQIATLKAQAFFRQGFAFSDPVTIA
jgi:hypothetical protein